MYKRELYLGFSAYFGFFKREVLEGRLCDLFEFLRCEEGFSGDDPEKYIKRIPYRIEYEGNLVCDLMTLSESPLLYKFNLKYGKMGLCVYNYEDFFRDKMYRGLHGVSLVLHALYERIRQEYGRYLIKVYQTLLASHLFAGSQLFLNNYFIPKCNGTMGQAYDVRFDDYLPQLHIIDDVEAQYPGISVDSLPIYHTEMMDDRMMFIDLWKESSGGNHDHYRRVCEALGKYCLWDIPRKKDEWER